jgi:hypothetical protein
LWEGALDVSASVGNYGAIDFEASGLSTFDDWAHLTGFDGAWIGQAITGTYKATVQGAVSAAKPERQLP